MDDGRHSHLLPTASAGGRADEQAASMPLCARWSCPAANGRGCGSSGASRRIGGMSAATTTSRPYGKPHHAPATPPHIVGLLNPTGLCDHKVMGDMLAISGSLVRDVNVPEPLGKLASQ